MRGLLERSRTVITQIKQEIGTMAKNIVIPLELKYDFAMRSYTFMLKAWLHVIREEYGAVEALRLYEKVCKIGDRTKSFTNTLLNIFKIEGNDAETIAKWWDIRWELIGGEVTWLERSKTISRIKVTKCPWSTPVPKDISDWDLIYINLVDKTINSKASAERPKGMCAGDPYCEIIHKIEE